MVDGGGDGWCKVIFMSNPTFELSWGCDNSFPVHQKNFATKKIDPNTNFEPTIFIGPTNPQIWCGDIRPRNSSQRRPLSKVH